MFDTQLELEHASVIAGFPSPVDDYRHETIVLGSQQYTQKDGKADVFANAIKHDYRNPNPTTRMVGCHHHMRKWYKWQMAVFSAAHQNWEKKNYIIYNIY